MFFKYVENRYFGQMFASGSYATYAASLMKKGRVEEIVERISSEFQSVGKTVFEFMGSEEFNELIQKLRFEGYRPDEVMR